MSIASPQVGHSESSCMVRMNGGGVGGSLERHKFFETAGFFK